MSTVVKDLGAVSAYAYAVEKGYTGTEAEFAELMADYAEVGQRAEDAADSALESKTAAQTAATTATNKASEATTAATTATTKAAEAQADADAAALDASQALSAASTATTKATEATTAAATATSAATTATTAKDDAVSAKTAAQTAQTGAETAAASVEASAAQIATNAEDISQLKSDLTTLAPKEDMLKAFPTDTASGSVASFADGANVPVKSLVVNIDPVQSGSGDPSPTNVRPISGWSEVNVGKCGKNTADVEYGNTVPSITNGEMVSANGWSTGFISVDNSKNYMFSFVSTAPTYVFYYDENHNYLGNQRVLMNTDISTSSYFADARYVKLRNDAVAGNDPHMQLEVGSTATPYEPYSGQSINIALGQTVYGGKLDVTKGELVIDRASVILDSTRISKSSSTRFSVSRNYIGNFLSSGAAIMNKFRQKLSSDGYNTSGIFFLDSNNLQMNAYKAFDTKDDFVSEYGDLQLCFTLAEPLTIQLTPHEVTALLGSNNIWADSGDSAVEYRADPTLYIQRLTEPDADMVADNNITLGSYFMVGNTLYKATANIASGATISPNVNCTRKSLSEALNELNV